jgi:hypothetical protein
MWEVFKQLKDKIYFVKHIVYKNKSRNHKSKINSYEASFKEIEGKEIRLTIQKQRYLF